MFDKFAEEAKEAEVRGVLAAFIDSGMMKVASSDDFDMLSAVVADNLGDTYTIDDVAEVTDAVLDDGFEKTAEVDDYLYAIGDAYLTKLAEDISDEEFEDYADELVKEAAKVGTVRKGLNAAKEWMAEGLSAKDLRKALKKRNSFINRHFKSRQAKNRKDILKGLAHAAGSYGAAGAGLAGAGLGAKALYDRLSD